MSRASRRKQDTLVTSLLDKGLVRFALGERDEAIDFWQRALSHNPRSSRARDYLQSVGAITRDELDELGDTTSEVAPVEEVPDDLNSGPAVDSLVPPFTEELPAYTSGDVSSSAEFDPDEETQDLETLTTDVEVLLGQARQEESAGNLEAALTKADEALKREPDHSPANALAGSLKKRLSEEYRKELEPLESVPFLRATDASILELSLDPIGGFLISQIDGEITVEELLTILGTFDEFRVLSSLHFFLENGIIELRA